MMVLYFYLKVAAQSNKRNGKQMSTNRFVSLSRTSGCCLHLGNPTAKSWRCERTNSFQYLLILCNWQVPSFVFWITASTSRWALPIWYPGLHKQLERGRHWDTERSKRTSQYHFLRGDWKPDRYQSARWARPAVSISTPPLQEPENCCCQTLWTPRNCSTSHKNWSLTSEYSVTTFIG